jgi:hypothetical protein
MAAPYLEEIAEAMKGEFRDLHELAAKVGIPFDSLCLSINNGMLKGYWKLVLTDDSE